MKEANSGTAYTYPVPFPRDERGNAEPQSRIVLLPDRFGFLCLLAFVSVTATPFGMTNPLWEVILTCSIFLLAAIKITDCILHGKGGWSEYKWVFAPFLCLLALTFIQTIQFKTGSAELASIRRSGWWAISADPSETMRFAFKLLSFILFGYLLLQYTKSPRNLLLLVHFIICLGVGSALLGMAQQAIGRGPAWLFPYIGYERAYGQFGNRNHFALLMEMSLGIALSLIATRGTHRKYLGPYLVAATIIFLAIVLTSSRGGVTSMLGMFLLVIIGLLIGLLNRGSRSGNHSERSERRAVKVLAGRAMLLTASFALIFLAVVWIGGDHLADRFERTGSDLTEQTDAGKLKEARSRIWSATLRLIEAHPILGIGFGGYATAIPQYHEDTGELVPLEAHNEYLELQASGGVIASLLFLWFIIQLLKRARLGLRSTQSLRRAATFGALVGLFGVALHSLIDSGLHITLNALVFMMLITVVIWKTPRVLEISGQARITLAQ